MPEAEVMLRTSERSTYRRCRQKWWWAYIDRQQPQRIGTALSFGTLVHQALEAWYIPGRKRGEHPAEAFVRLFEAQPIDRDVWDEDGNRIDPTELGVAMLTGYVDRWGLEPHIEIIQSEMTFEIDVYDKLGNYLVTYVGKFDSVYLDHLKKRFGMYEHKTAKTVEEVFINSGYGEQGISYFWGANTWLRHIGVLSADQHLDHVMYNFLRKGMPDTRPKDADGYALNKPAKDALQVKCEELGLPTKGTVDVLTERLEEAGVDVPLLGEISKVQPKPLFNRQELIIREGELERINWRIRAEAYEMSLVRQGKLPVYKNPTKDCRWDCPFKDPCELHEMGADYEDVLELEFHTWDPYNDHELTEERGH